MRQLNPWPCLCAPQTIPDHLAGFRVGHGENNAGRNGKKYEGGIEGRVEWNGMGIKGKGEKRREEKVDGKGYA